jgi:hypothetical protein
MVHLEFELTDADDMPWISAEDLILIKSRCDWVMSLIRSGNIDRVFEK